MFDNLDRSDWIALLAIFFPMLAASIGSLFLTARNIGAWGSEMSAMKVAIKDLEEKVDHLGRVDLAVQLVSQAMVNLGDSFHEFREESREGRRDTRAAIESVRSEVKQEMGEIRVDVRNIMTGRVQPPSRGSSRD